MQGSCGILRGHHWDLCRNQIFMQEPRYFSQRSCAIRARDHRNLWLDHLETLTKIFYRSTARYRDLVPQLRIDRLYRMSLHFCPVQMCFRDICAKILYHAMLLPSWEIKTLSWSTFANMHHPCMVDWSAIDAIMINDLAILWLSLQPLSMISLLQELQVQAQKMQELQAWQVTLDAVLVPLCRCDSTA